MQCETNKMFYTSTKQLKPHLSCDCCFFCRLLVYPPPPAKGGISVTNEDLHCLNDGEFLNDVIIDFYLKSLSLFQSILSVQTKYIALKK